MTAELERLVVDRLREWGAAFAFVHGSRASGTAGPATDLDVAAWFGRPVDSWVVAGPLPAEVDLLVLDDAPLELAGRVALRGRLLLDDDPPARVRWQADTRKVYLDEAPRREQDRRDFAAGRLHGRPR
jgi:predicted nucleotidyltransferase